MLFKSNTDYAPDAGSDDAPEPEAVAVADVVRQRLGELLSKRSEAEAEMQRAREAIARLQSYVAGPAAIEREIAELDSGEADLIARWSTAGGEFPVLNADRRHELEQALAEARNKSSGAQRAIPGLEAEFSRAANSANAIGHAINAAIAEIVLESSLAGLAKIAALKLEIAERQEIAGAARELSLRMVESIPLANRVEIASGYFKVADAWESARVAAVSTPAPSRERVTTWSRLVDSLKTNASAQVAHQAEAA